MIRGDDPSFDFPNFHDEPTGLTCCRASSVQGMLHWAYWAISSDTAGNVFGASESSKESLSGIKMSDIKVEAGWILRCVSRLSECGLTPELPAILEAKYGERPEGVRTIAVELGKIFPCVPYSARILSVYKYCEREGGEKREHMTVLHKRMDEWHTVATDRLSEIFIGKGWLC